MGGKRKASLPETIDMKPSDGYAPFVVQFPSGFDPEKTDAECTWETHEHAKRKSQYALVAKTAHNIDFLGTNSAENQSNASACKYILGVFDKSSNELSTAPIQGDKIFRMEPRARTLDYTKNNATKNIKNEQQQQRRELNARLVEEFGSQRRKRQLAQAKAGQVDAEHVSAGGAVLGLIASAGKDLHSRDAVIKASLIESRNLPPHHADGKTADEAYRYDEIIPVSVGSALEIEVLSPADGTGEYKEKLLKSKIFGNGYVLSRICHFALQNNNDIKESQARCLVFLGHLLKLITGRMGNLLKLKQGQSISEVAERLTMKSSVLEGILNLFYTREGNDDGIRYILSKEKRNLMLSWVLILALRAEPFSIMEPQTFQLLADELKMRPSEVATQYRELGCVVARSTAGGVKSGVKVSLMPPATEQKVLGDCFPALKLGRSKK